MAAGVLLDIDGVLTVSWKALPGAVETIAWLGEHDYESVAQLKGSMSQQNVAKPAAYNRANYMKVLSSYSVRDLAMQGTK